MRSAFSATTSVLFLLTLLFPDRLDAATTFDTWTLGFNSSDNHFDNGPNVITTSGSNAVGISFANTVYSPGTTIDNFITSSCGASNCIAGFYYTLPMQFKVNSPSLDVTAGHDYAIQFNVNSSNFHSTADLHVETPHVTFEYVSSNPAVTGCGSCAISLVPDSTGLFSIEFVPVITGPIAFGLDFTTGRNPNGGASSSGDLFSETGSYVYSNFSVADLSASQFADAVPEPSTWAMLLIGFAGLWLASYRRMSKRALMGTPLSLRHYAAIRTAG